MITVIQCEDFLIPELASLEKEFTKKDFKILAKKIELFAENLEDHISLLDFLMAEKIETLLEEILLFLKVKIRTNCQEQSFTRRIRFASVFALSLIDNLRREAEIENNELIKDFTSISCFED
jgi:hypothetical protein